MAEENVPVWSSDDYQPSPPPRTPNPAGPHHPSIPATAKTVSNLGSIPDLEEVVDEMQKEIVQLRKEKREIQKAGQLLLAENEALRKQNPSEIFKELDELRDSNEITLMEHRDLRSKNLALRKEMDTMAKELERMSNELETQCVSMGLEIEDLKGLVSSKAVKSTRKSKDLRDDLEQKDRELECLKEKLVQKDREIFKLKAAVIQTAIDSARASAKTSKGGR